MTSLTPPNSKPSRRFVLLLLICLSAITATMKAANPFVRHIFTADPSARVFDGRLYVYTSHDRDKATSYDMVDWRLFSTDDMVTWKDHGAVFQLKDFAWAEKYAWAPDAIAANGKYYLFLPTDRSKCRRSPKVHHLGSLQSAPLLDVKKGSD